MPRRILIDATLPDDGAVDALLKLVRSFDKSCSGCHFSVAAQVGEQNTVPDLIRMLEGHGLEIVFAAKRGKG